MVKTITIDHIDEQLPQTQCGLCEYKGCRPYATAILEENERIDRCPPGGVETLIALATLLNQNPTPYLDEMRQKTKPTLLAVIREAECIGCTKCIQACPTDAILGTGKRMHTVINDACTGCELCVEPCPVDCIDMLEIPAPTLEAKKENAATWRARYEKRNARLERDKKERQQKHQKAKLSSTLQKTIAARKTAIQAAVERARLKKDRINLPCHSQRSEEPRD